MNNGRLVVWMRFPNTVLKEVDYKEYDLLIGEFSCGGWDSDKNTWIRRVAEPTRQFDSKTTSYRVDIPFGKKGRRLVSLHDEYSEKPCNSNGGGIITPYRGIKDHDGPGLPYHVCVSELPQMETDDGRVIVSIQGTKFFLEKKKKPARFIFTKCPQ